MKPYYLIRDKEEIIKERDDLEMIFVNEGKLTDEQESRMRNLGIQCYRLFKVPLSILEL
jgi:hypothetical protein